MLSLRWIFALLLSITFFNGAIVSAQTQSRGISLKVKKLQEEEGFQPYRKKFGLVIGIDDYTGAITPLHYAVADARSIHKMLMDDLGFDEVILLENENATRKDILKSIGILRQETQADDQVFFYFAGHGISFGSGSSEMGYLVPQNATGFAQEDIELDGISMTDLRERLVKLPAKHVLLAVDACYGGYAAVSNRALPIATQNYIKVITSSKARQIITAGKRDEVVQESSDWGHSAFTYKLLDGLQKALADGDDNGIITTTELYAFLSASVNGITNGQQTPQFAKLANDEGEFVFILPETAVEKELEDVKPAKKEVSLGAVTVLYGSVEITNSINGTLFVDGEPIAKVYAGTVLPVKDLQAGAHTIEIQSDDGNWSREVSVTANETVKLNAALVAEKEAGAPAKPVPSAASFAVYESKNVMVLVKGGTFEMGDVFGDGDKDEKPVHPVTVTDFFISQYEVTVADFRKYCKDTKRDMPEQPRWGWMDDHPVVNVSWQDAKAYCAWLTDKTGTHYRLPYEAEWEYAARNGGKKLRFPVGDKISKETAQYGQNAKTGSVVPVGSFKPNDLGIYDMAGNAAEWCEDWYGPYTDTPKGGSGMKTGMKMGHAITNPKGADSGKGRVFRGGSWQNTSDSARTTERNWFNPNYGYERFGFRVCVGTD